MTETKFWDIIAQACKADPELVDEWEERLQARLEKLTADEILEWDRLFERFVGEAYFKDMWGAAYLINGGASDDGFYYFRCWLVAMGKKVFTAAVANPDSLAGIHLDEEAEAELYAVARQAWMTVTKKTWEDYYPVKHETVALRGEDWNFDDDEEMPRRLPRLFARYGE